MGIRRVKGTPIHESLVECCETELQLVRYELFVDPRREVRHGTTLGSDVLTEGGGSRECRWMDVVTVRLTQEDIALLVDALEAYEYWELRRVAASQQRLRVHPWRPSRRGRSVLGSVSVTGRRRADRD